MREETAQVPAELRAAVDERDGGVCRLCGRYLGTRRVIHHIHYGGDDVGMGGRRRHGLDNLITVCGDFDGGCHGRAHADKTAWQPVLAALTQLPGVTALQYRRWTRT